MLNFARYSEQPDQIDEWCHSLHIGSFLIPAMYAKEDQLRWSECNTLRSLISQIDLTSLKGARELRSIKNGRIRRLSSWVVDRRIIWNLGTGFSSM